MNVFVLDRDPQKAAIYHIDVHVRKMVLESAQMLSTAIRLNNPGEHPVYKTAYAKHPCTIKCITSRANFLWVLDLMKSISKEFEYRFGKQHKSSALIPYFEKMAHTIPESPLEFAQAMPDEYKDKCPIKAYRSYYRGSKMKDKNGKAMNFWTKRGVPEWLSTQVQ